MTKCLSSCVRAQLLSYVWLFVTPWTVDCQAPLSKDFSRQLYWSGLPFPPPGGLPNPGIEPRGSSEPRDWTHWQVDCLPLRHLGSPVSRTLFSAKEPPCQCRRHRFDPGLGRSPGEGNGNPLQYSCLENPMDRRAWQSTVHGVTKSQTQLKWLSMHTCLHWQKNM